MKINETFYAGKLHNIKLPYNYSYNFVGKDYRRTEKESRWIMEDTTVVVHNGCDGGLDKNGWCSEEKKIDSEYISGCTQRTC